MSKLTNPPGAFKSANDVRKFINAKKGRLYLAPTPGKIGAQSDVMIFGFSRSTYTRGLKIFQTRFTNVWDDYHGCPLYLDFLTLKGQQPVKAVYLCGPHWYPSSSADACLFTNYWEAYAHAIRWKQHHEYNAIHP